MLPKSDYLEKLKTQRAKLEARIQAAEARSKASERKQDTRRKILIGSYYLEHAQKNNDMETLKHIMADYLTRPTDRKLFDLPELPEAGAVPNRQGVE